MKFLGKMILALMALTLLGGVLAIGAVLFVLHRYGADMPDFSQLASYEPPVVTRVHAGDGQLLQEYARQKRVFVPFEAIPPQLVHAFVSAEDQHFFEHAGLDFIGIARAVVSNLKQIGSGRRPEGASTITQQVAKNFLLTNEVSLERKLKEAILAIRIERAFPKSKILELYLNEIYLGSGSYGVAAAALNYFDKSLDELDLAEMAYLAALPKAPSNYNPVRNHDAAVERRNYVLKRMAEDGYITPAARDAAIAEPLVSKPHHADQTVEAGHFTEEVRRQLFDRFGEAALYDGGLSVRTTLEPALQALATRSLRDGLEAYDRRHGWRGPVRHFDDMTDWEDQLGALPAQTGRPSWRYAVVLKVDAARAEIGFSEGKRGEIPYENLKWARKWLPDQHFGDTPKTASEVLQPGDVVLVSRTVNTGDDQVANDIYELRQVPQIDGGIVVLDPHTGRVLALEGGFNFADSQFNRVTQAHRQPGSLFKPFVYLTGLRKGLTPSTLINDAPIVFDQGAGLGNWKPENYSREFFGPTPLRVGIEKSRNVMTVRIAQYVTPEAIKQTAGDFDIDLNIAPTLSMALGAGEVTLMDMVTAYGMLANGGRRIEPSLIDRVQDRKGMTVWQHDPRHCDGCQGLLWQAAYDMPVPELPDWRAQVGDPRRIYQIVHIMEGVVQRGTGRRLSSLGVPMAGKTGTTNDGRDAWFIGFTPDMVVGVYTGFDEPRTLGRRETGSSVALPIVQEFLTALQERGQLSAIPFRVPEGIRLMRVDASSGTRAPAGDRNAIWEAFMPGTEPGDQPMLLGNDGKVRLGSVPTGAGEASGGGTAGGTGAGAIGTGTGGLY